jgi:hypothetical protein
VHEASSNIRTPQLENGPYAATESLRRRRARKHAATLLPMKGSMGGNSPFNSFQ